MDAPLDSLTQLVLNQGFQSLGKIVAYSGGFIAIAYAVFRLSAIKWLDSHFAKKIEELRHLHTQELKEVEFRINSLFDRRKRLNDKEYQVLPEAWGKITEAYWKTLTALSGAWSGPNLKNMPVETFHEFVAATNLSAWEKRELLSAPNKDEYYRDRVFANTFHAAKEASKDFHAYLSKNGIFLLPDLKEKFRKIDDLIWNALVTYETNRERARMGITPSQSVNRSVLEKEVDALLADLEAIVQGRLNE